MRLKRRAAALVLASIGVAGLLATSLTARATVGAPAQSTSPTFLRQSAVELPDRDRIFDSTDQVDGCGALTATSHISIDGHGADWVGRPNGIAGTARYDHGEYIWTDYPFDDDGTGTFQYPGEGEALIAQAGTAGKASPRLQRYGANAADVVETRIAADATTLDILVRLNFVNALDATVVGLALDTDGDATDGFSAWPHGAGLNTPGTDLFVTAYGRCALVATLAGEQSIAVIGGAVRIGTADNIIEIALPRSLLNGAHSIRIAGGAGLWDPTANAWLGVSSSPATAMNAADTPKGASKNSDPAVFNLMFRDDEFSDSSCDGTTSAEVKCAHVSPRAFQSDTQHTALAAGNTGSYQPTIDIDRLASSTSPNDPLAVRQADRRDFTRVYRSRINAEGVLVNGTQNAVFLSRYQPYGTYAPACYESGSCPWPATNAPMLVLLHGGSQSHVASAPRLSIAEGGTDLYGVKRFYDGLEAGVAPVIVRPLGRGQRSPWWRGYGEADVLEAMTDASARYDTDVERTGVGGASLGGYGTLRLASLYPDLWNSAATHCPAEYEDTISARDTGNVDPSLEPFVIDPMMPAMLNLPYRQASGTLDPLEPIVANHRLRDSAIAAQLDFRYTEYLTGGHCFDLAEASAPWIPNHNAEAIALLRAPRTATPARLRYVVDARQYPPGPESMALVDMRDLGIDYQGAYWASRLQVRPEVLDRATTAMAGEDVVASIDVASHMLPGWQIGAESCGTGTGVAGVGGVGTDPQLTPPLLPTPYQYECHAQTRAGETESAIDITVQNLAGATLDMSATAITGSAFTVVATGDGAFDLTLSGVTTTASGPCVTGSFVATGATTLHLMLAAGACTISLD